MNTTFALYQSGVLRGEFVVKGAEAFVCETDARGGEISALCLLDEDRNKYFMRLYNINLAHIRDNLQEYAHLASELPVKISAPWGQFYEQWGSVGHYAGRRGAYPMDFTVRDGRAVAFTVAARDFVTVLVLRGYEEFTILKQWSKIKVSPPVYGVRNIGTMMVEMRDGVRLATEIWLPDTDEKVPVILTRTPYGRLSKANDYFRFVARGYAVCIQDVRGCGDSEGIFQPKYFETEDGDDTLNFIVEQSFCNGNIGMFGASYLGCTQWAAAASGNAHLKAIVSIVTSGDPFTDLPRKGGAFASGVMAWAFSLADRKHKKENMERVDWGEIMRLRPLKDIPEMVLGEKIPFWTEWCHHERYDHFWERCNWFTNRHKINVPALIVSGWYDDNGAATTQALEIVADYPSQDRKVILGPWMHQGNGRREIHGIEFGVDALRYDLDLCYQLWFDNKLKGVENGIERGARVEYYEVGSEVWKSCDNWPPEDIVLTPLYIGSSGSAQSSGGDGVLSFESFDQEHCDSYLFDPDNPAPHIIDMSENEICVPENYSDMERRSDVLIYTSEPLTEPLSVAGDLSVEFYASSSAKDTDWIVRVTDVDEKGNSIRLCDGLLRAKFRNGFDRIDLLEPGKVEHYVIRMSKISCVFGQGHRIRLQVTSGAENYIFPNPNTGSNFFLDTDSLIAEQCVYHGGVFPSKVILPVTV